MLITSQTDASGVHAQFMADWDIRLVMGAVSMVLIVFAVQYLFCLGAWPGTSSCYGLINMFSSGSQEVSSNSMVVVQVSVC